MHCSEKKKKKKRQQFMVCRRTFVVIPRVAYSLGSDVKVSKFNDFFEGVAAKKSKELFQSET